MAITGIQLFKLTPKTNCGECGVPTCLAFAMQLASGKSDIEQCPYLSDESRVVISEVTRQQQTGLRSYIGRRISLEKIESNRCWKKDRKRKATYVTSFSSRDEVPSDSCYKGVNISVFVQTRDLKITDITNLIHVTEKNGCERHFHSDLPPPDEAAAINLIEKIVEE
jgi:Na+-translocating ferredoxin:NAD+ oxidoreductase RNF subunit RnfB